MAEAAYILGAAVQTSAVLDAPRHSALVRITHWIFTLSFFGLVVSGFAIILAHPHFYWGETGSIGTPSLFDLPLPTMLGGPSGWGRSLHFQSAWFAVLSGLLYAISGLFTQHFRKQLLPRRADLSWRSMRAGVLDHLRFKRPVETDSYNLLQRLSYLAVVFLFFPLIILTGLAMSPAITSVVPQIVTVFGGYESARTLHFFLADFLVLFLLVHVAMVILGGFKNRMLAMITGRPAASRKQAL
jgi:thiosulfate reductase cytochrome b subunit